MREDGQTCIGTVSEMTSLASSHMYVSQDVAFVSGLETCDAIPSIPRYTAVHWPEQELQTPRIIAEPDVTAVVLSNDMLLPAVLA